MTSKSRRVSQSSPHFDQSNFPGSLSYKYKQPNISSPTASDNEHSAPAPSGKRALFKKKAEQKKPENVQEKEKTPSESQKAATKEIPGDRFEVKKFQKFSFRPGVLGSIR